MKVPDARPVSVDRQVELRCAIEIDLSIIRDSVICAVWRAESHSTI